MGPKKLEKEKNQHIQVAIRCRPLNSIEKKQGSYNVVDINSDRREVHIKERPLPTAAAKTFTFDRVFGPQAQQIELYKTTVVPIIEEVLLGYNCTIFAYGQTGTGKTFTMEGERSEDPSISWDNDPLSGIIPRAMHQVFTRLDKMSCEYTVRVSFLEIYNEELIDLLGAESVENPRLKIYEDVTKKGTHVIQGLEDVVIHNKESVYSVLERGTQRRQTAATLMNAHSSRSHSVFMVTIHMKENSVDGEELLKTGKLNLVDLAGSECIGRSGAVDKRAREAGNINQSLLTLGRVITALVEHAPHVPYRESKLTRLLQDSLGGRTKTSIIATISPASCNIEETLSTLDYAHRAKNITNRPEINQKLTKKALLKEYTEEMERLRKDLQAARDKNGIFIAEENYTSMQTEILQQKDNIKDLEEKIDFLNSEIYKLNELFTDTKQELEETSKELQVTTKNLEETSENLEKTQKNLSRTRQDRDEQKHIVMQHVKTETKLYGQASQLKYTADESTRDVSGLHAKLDRKQSVESHNNDVQESFRVDFRENIDSMESQLKAFTDEQLQTISTVEESMDTLLSKRAEEVKTVSQDISGVVTMVTDQLTSLHQSQAQHVDGVQQWADGMVEHCEKSRDSEICRQFEFHEQTFLTAMSSICSMLTQISTDLQNVQLSLETKMKEQQANVESFVDEQLSSLCQQRKMVSEYSDAMATRLQHHKQQSADVLKSQQEKDKILASKFLKGVETLMTDMLNSQEEHLEQHVNTIVDDLSESEKQSTDFHSAVHRHIDGISDTAGENRTKLLDRSTENYNASKQALQEIQAVVSKTNNDSSSLQGNVTTFHTTGREVCTSSADSMLEMINQHIAESKEQLSHHQTDTEALSSCCTTSLKSLDSKLTNQQTELQTVVQSQQATLKQQSKAVSDWSESHCSALETRDKDVELFLTNQIRKDIPTGTTPQRRGFSYPHSLAKTSRHSLILQEFRKTYLLEEAMNLPLPDESGLLDKSNSSQFQIPQFNLDEADNDGSNGTGVTEDTESDALNLSGDSAFSTNSSSVSDTDKILRSESKENIMRPPNVRPSKARTTSSKTKKLTHKSTPNRTTPLKGSGVNTTVQGSAKPSSRLPLRSNNP